MEEAASDCGVTFTSSECRGNFTFPEPDFEFDIDDDFEADVLAFAMDPVFSMDRSLTKAEINTMIVRWEAPTGTGMFLDHPHRFLVRWAIRLIELFRADIPNNGQFCPEARTKVITRLERLGYHFHVNDGTWELGDCNFTPCATGNVSISLCDGTHIPERAAWDVSSPECA